MTANSDEHATGHGSFRTVRVLTESGSVDLWCGERHRNDRGEGIAP